MRDREVRVLVISPPVESKLCTSHSRVQTHTEEQVGTGSRTGERQEQALPEAGGEREMKCRLKTLL